MIRRIDPADVAADEPIESPASAALLTEIKAIGQAARLALSARSLKSLGPGEGPVICLPGFGWGDPVMAPLRGFLATIGFDAREWGLGINRGNVPVRVPEFRARLGEVFAETGVPVALVGWSLGGIIAREVARGSEQVRAVVTLGSPIIDGPSSTVMGGLPIPGRDGPHPDSQREPIRCPVTSIFTRSDAVVSWRSSIDRQSPDVHHYEVEGTHGGLVLNPDVYRIVANELTRRAPLG